jgi:hypothetical protein
MNTYVQIVVSIVAVVLLLNNCSSEVETESAEVVIEDALEVTAIGKDYSPDENITPILQMNANNGGNTSVRNVDSANLIWKEQGYFQRNRDLGQVFTPDETFWLHSIILRTGPDDKAVLSGSGGERVYMQLFEVEGDPTINDNNTPQGTESAHGFTSNHRADDFIEGVDYTSLRVITGGVFPDIPASYDGEKEVNADSGKFVYMRWTITGKPFKCEVGKKYAFMVGFEEPGLLRGFTLANDNRAATNAPAVLTSEADAYTGGWALRREGDGTRPPTMFPGENPPTDSTKYHTLIHESLFPKDLQHFTLKPTTEGFPDVDTYRDLQFAIEVHWDHP